MKLMDSLVFKMWCAQGCNYSLLLKGDTVAQVCNAFAPMYCKPPCIHLKKVFMKPSSNGGLFSPKRGATVSPV